MSAWEGPETIMEGVMIGLVADFKGYELMMRGVFSLLHLEPKVASSASLSLCAVLSIYLSIYPSIHLSPGFEVFRGEEEEEAYRQTPTDQIRPRPSHTLLYKIGDKARE